MRIIALPCPVDLRKYQNDGQTCGICNLTASYQCKVEIEPHETFDDTLRTVSACMSRQKRGDGCLKAPILLHALFPVLPHKAMRGLLAKVAPVRVISYTNVGSMDGERLSFGDL